MARFVTAAGLTLVAGTAVVLAPPALAASAPAPTVSAPAAAAARGDENLQALVLRAAPSPRPSAPTVEASVVPSDDVAEPRPSQTDGRDPGDIEVPAGKADVSDAPVPGHSNDLLAVMLAGGGALLLAGGAVVVVSRRRA